MFHQFNTIINLIYMLQPIDLVWQRKKNNIEATGEVKDEDSIQWQF